MRIFKRGLFCILIVILLAGFASAQSGSNYNFTMKYEVKYTPVKNQASTGTCWSFATTSFLESELLRMGKGEFDLSEMFSVKHAYTAKALNYVRNHGHAQYGQGGLAHNVIDMMRLYGAVPESVFDGKNIGEENHDFSEMQPVLTAMLDAVIKNRKRKLTPRWLEAYNKVLDVYMGDYPTSFEYKGKTYTPKSFLKDVLGLKLDDYVEITSYTHHPFYTTFCLEIPDNWSHYTGFYNVPMDDLTAIADYAFKNGYSVAFDGDVSERGRFNMKKGYARIPAKDAKGKADDKEMVITQELRQKTFDNYQTTDDHLMHLVGLAYDQNGTKYYKTKNSWGPSNLYDGFLFMSEAYFKFKTVFIMVHKDAIPDEIAKKLKLK